jgi:hypothetical protein
MASIRLRSSPAARRSLTNFSSSIELFTSAFLAAAGLPRRTGPALAAGLHASRFGSVYGAVGVWCQPLGQRARDPGLSADPASPRHRHGRQGLEYARPGPRALGAGGGALQWEARGQAFTAMRRTGWIRTVTSSPAARPSHVYRDVFSRPPPVSQRHIGVAGRGAGEVKPQAASLSARQVAVPAPFLVQCSMRGWRMPLTSSAKMAPRSSDTYGSAAA